jgi:hypothetical protein
MFFNTVSYEHNWKYWLAILAIKKSDKNSENVSGFFIVRTKPWPPVMDLFGTHALQFSLVTFPGHVTEG